MKIAHIDDMKGGWLIGDFEPSLLKTSQFEVAYKFFDKGEVHEAHIHKIATEFNYLTKGKLIIRGRTLEAGDIFVIEPGEVADPVFLENCEIMVVKTPSVKDDKYTETT